MRVPPVSGSGEGARAGGVLGQKANRACGAALGRGARWAARLLGWRRGLARELGRKGEKG
jgi:hypothetical protein